MNRKLVARLLATASVIASAFGVAAPANAQTPARPNIVIIWGDDIGISHVSA